MSWERVAGLELTVDGYTVERLEADMLGGFHRVTALYALSGAGHTGTGEDIGLDHEDPQPAPADLDLAGRWTLGSFCEHLASVEQWPEPPKWGELQRNWRNWAFESAALDLALRQAGVTLAEAVGREPRPLTFVNSLGLGDPPDVDRVARRFARYPSIGFKLDADASWTDEIVGRLAELGCVRTVDFKGRYGFEVADLDALEAMYHRVIAAFPDALFEDPHAELEALIPRERLSFDGTILSAADIGDTRTINVKPSRIGSLRKLFEVYEHCERHGVAMYGGGMGELGIGRGQIELLASLFHPDGPNDVAPSPFNAPDPPDGLPASPLQPPPLSPGFHWG